MIHGVGEQTSSFAADARHHLRQACMKQGAQLHCTQVHWAPLADRHQKKFLEGVESHGSKGNMAQKLVIGTLADALMYRSNPELQEQIFYMIDQQIWMLGAPVVICAHSLGGLIAADYIRARPKLKRIKLLTFGCNIGLFTLGSTFDCPPQLRQPNAWLNFYYASDLLGFPLAVDPALDHVIDVELGRKWLSWSRVVGGLAHLDYWGDTRFWSKTVPALLNV